MKENSILKEIQHKLGFVVLMWIVSVAFLSLFSWSTSCMYEIANSDSNVFMLMGKYTKQGLIPYKDVFDHKGPVMVFIEWLGFSVCDSKTGILLIQSIFLTISLSGIYKIARLLLNIQDSIILTIFSLLIINIYIEGGNLTEEYCLPFLIWSTYFAIKYLYVEIKNSKGHNKWYAFVYGITFMICALTRITNALPLCGIMLIGFYWLVIKKQWENIIQNIIYFILGNVIIFFPVAIYFISKDAFGEMIYSTFIFNFKYAGEMQGDILSVKAFKYALQYITPIYISLTIGLIIFFKRKEEHNISIVVIVLSVIALLFQAKSSLYPHYLLIWVPEILLAVMMLINILRRDASLKHITIFIVFMLTSMVIIKNGLVIRESYRIYKDTSVLELKEEFNVILDEIPHEDRKYVWGYNVTPYFYIVTDINPCYRNFILQDFQCSMDEKMKRDFEKDVRSLKAEYIVEKLGTENELDYIIYEYYEEVIRTKQYVLLKKITKNKYDAGVDF